MSAQCSAPAPPPDKGNQTHSTGVSASTFSRKAAMPSLSVTSSFPFFTFAPL